MTFSENTLNLLLDIKEFAGGKIKNDYDLTILLDSSFRGDGEKDFHKLIFKAKFINGLFGILTDDSNQDKIDKLMPEFTKNLEEFLELLLKILEYANTDSRKYFLKKYFELNQGIINELINLIIDLSTCKDFFNFKKSLHG